MRSHMCAEISVAPLETSVELCGWVHRRRDHGGVIFIDLRDRSGLAQIVFQPEKVDVFKQAEHLRSEYVIQVKGVIKQRPEAMTNAGLPTGHLEIFATELTIFNESKTPPFPLNEQQFSAKEEIRLQYRYLDLRRPEMQERLIMRARAFSFIRQYLEKQGFIDIETPMLTRPTPEGARDYLVPSRTHPGEFFALPQSPQLFKQLFMIAGLDRYYQIVRCFRDEDLRSDRQPEFTQLDIETSFWNEEAIQACMEGLIRALFLEILKVELPVFPKMTYQEAMRRYGCDKPDLRIPLEFVDIADLVKETTFQVFSSAANHPQGRVLALRLPGGCQRLSRKQLDDYETFVKKHQAKGLAYIKVNDRAQGVAGLQSPILKFFQPEVLEAILTRAEAQTGDILFFGADHRDIVNASMSALRIQLGHDCGLLEPGFKPLWVTHFPMFEVVNGQLNAMHHPFTAPCVESIEELQVSPETALARAYDMVLNGYEIGGGSIRIHTPAMQTAVFKLLGIEEHEAKEKFGFLLEALEYGCPPLGGLAFGLDRVLMLMAGVDSIREVIAYPKTQSAACLMTAAPSPASEAQLKELGIQLCPETLK